MIKTQNIIFKIYVIKFPIYVCHQIPDEYIVQNQPPVVFFRPATLLKRDSNTGVVLIFRNTYFEKHLQTAASDSSYILHKKLHSRTRLPFCFILKHKITLFCFSFVFICFITRFHSLSLIVIFYYSLSFVVTFCHSLSLVVPLVVTRCTTRCHSLSFVVPLVAICCHSLSLAVTRFYHLSVFL